MRSRALWGCCVMLGLASMASGAFAQDRALTTAKTDENGAVQVEASTAVVEPAPAPLRLVPLEPGMVFERYVVVAPGADATADTDEQLVYSNTLGTFGAPLGAGMLFADDLTISVIEPCRLRRFEFPVVGKIDPNGIGGDYTVSWALYTNCPGSVPSTSRAGLIITGTQGQITFTGSEADAPGLISFVAGANVALKRNMWLGVTFSRDNAGVVVGAPPLEGFSCDQFDFPGSPCSNNFGGFPNDPQGSMNLEIYADSACAAAYTGYKDNKPSGSPYNPGANVVFADDVELVDANCNLVGYEVAIKGSAFYTFDLRNNCEGPAIPGTERSVIISQTTDVKIARFTFDPPIPLPQQLWFSAQISNRTGGVVIAGQDGCIGRSANFIGILGQNGCDQVDPFPSSIHAAFSLAITCAGPAPLGACCDMFITDPNGASVCREVSQTNCAFPPRGSSDQPAWVPGGVCVPDPFGANSCGKAACCEPDDSCVNLTFNECNAVLPVDRPRQWQRGRYCSEQGQHCPLNACLGRTGECTLPRVCPPACPPIGCQDPTCCDKVCRLEPFGPYCCLVEWDQTCADIARVYCDIKPSNDVCAPTRDMEGARLMTTTPPDNTAESDHGRATVDDSDPGFGCYLDNPGNQGLQTVWYKFYATQTSAVLQTCLSNAPATDSLLEVFAVGDPSTPVTQCRTLMPIGCSDDVQGCSASNKNSKMCLRDLIPGNLYYVLVASKVALSPGKGYRLDISTSPTPCINPTPSAPGDYCPGALPIVQLPGHPNDSTTTFNMAGSAIPPVVRPMTLDAPIETCIPSMTADMWYRYTATCSGTLTVDTCGVDPASSPDTNLAIYDQGLCPPMSAAAIACNADALGNCGLGSRLQIDVVQGNRYTIRLADSGANFPAGNLKITCAQAACPSGTLTFTSPPDGVVDAGRPHDPSNAALLQGLQTFKATGPHAAQASCLSVCETGGGPPNSVANLVEVEGPPGTYTYTITLARPITGGVLTTITYTDLHGGKSTGRFTSHPANVNADLFAQSSPPSDVQALLDGLNGVGTLLWGKYSGDVNRSESITPADVLEVIDLLNGAGAYNPWAGTVNPSDSTACPPP